MDPKIVKSVGTEMAALMPLNDKPWYKKRNLAFLNFCIISVFLLSSSNGYDGSMMNGVLALPQWQEFMGYPRGAWLGFISAAQFCGSIPFYPLAALMCNRFGRKPTIWAGYAFLCLGAGIQAGAPTRGAFVAGRAIVGMGSSFFAGGAPLLMSETAYPTQRGTLTSLYNCGWYVGSFLAAWVAYGVRDMASSWAWRTPSLLQIGIPVLVIPGLLMIPESPRYLISKGRTDEARAFLIKYHAEGDENSPLATFEFAEICKSIELEKANARSTSYMDMLRTPANRRRTFLSVFLGVFDQWAGQNIAGYYLSPVLTTVGVTSVTNQTLINGCLQIWNGAFAFTGAFNVDRVGRRFLFLASTGGMLVSYILITALSATFAKTQQANVGIAVIPFLFIMYGMFSLAFTPLLVTYPVEIWQYELRSRGLSVTMVSTSLAVFFNVFVNPIALDAIAWKYYLVYVFILLGSGFVFYFMFPETRGYSLEEIAQIFDKNADMVPTESEMSSEKGSMGHVEVKSM